MSFYEVNETIDNALWDMVAAASGYPTQNITWGKTNKIRPQDPYITLRQVNMERVARGRSLGIDYDTCIETTADDYILKYEIAAFREDPINQIRPKSTCMELSLAFVSTQYANILADAKVGFSDSTNVIDISVQIDNATWEQRASFVVTLLCAISNEATAATDAIESTEIEQNLLDAAEDLVSQETYTIPDA